MKRLVILISVFILILTSYFCMIEAGTDATLTTPIIKESQTDFNINGVYIDYTVSPIKVYVEFQLGNVVAGNLVSTKNEQIVQKPIGEVALAILADIKAWAVGKVLVDYPGTAN